jgi:hypothetical protein
MGIREAQDLVRTMSYWVYLENPKGKSVSVENHHEGGSYVVGGTNLAELNVTYNYGSVYGKLIGGTLKDALNGKKASEVIPMLEKVVGILGTKQDEDYWKPTQGNAGHALSILLGWARQYPEAKFRVS